MKKEVFAVYDKVAEMFGNIHAEVNEASAIRAFITSFQDNPNKNDYEIYNMGMYIDHSGEIIGCPPKRVYSGLDIKSDNVVDLPSSLKEQAE